MPMTDERMQYVQQVFDKARSKSPAERAAFVAQACGEDAELRSEVETLLSHLDRAGDLFMRPAESDAPVRERMPDPATDRRIGASIAGCRIRSVIDAGGMGTVYLAEQENPRRDVALKIMHRYVASRSTLRRFQFESQILAKLRHPNIAQVHLAGMSDDGDGERAPYFVMEYIPGARTLIDYADDEKLDIGARLELFAKICDAVHHGHQKGVIHRDLKPANILVDAAGDPKVIDFGVARSTDADVAVTTQMTEVGQIIGTLQYMSPEQCAADPQEIDTRSDVYSLGVVLFELLTGRLPYDVSHMTIQSAARSICEQAPAAPGTFDRRLRGDLDTIVLKALDKNRDKRYPSAESLAADVRRYLMGEPISARSPTRWTRAMRWVTRHPKATTVITSISVAAIVIAATFAGIWVLNSEPYELVLYRDGQPIKLGDTDAADQVRLYSISGRLLRAWGGQRHSIVFAAFIPKPPSLGSGRIAIIGYSPHHSGSDRGTLVGYDTTVNSGGPIWSQRLDEQDLLRELRTLRGMTGAQFMVHRGTTADIFSDSQHPGPEIVVVWSPRLRSQRAICVYDLTGRLLYRAWHDGSADRPLWLSQAGLLAFAGDNALYNWERNGDPKKPFHPNPRVVFALRPEPGHFGTGWLSGEPGDGPGRAVWYKWLYYDDRPVSVEDRLYPWLGASLSAEDRGRQASLMVEVDPSTGAGVSWTIDENGDELPETRLASDRYVNLFEDSQPHRSPPPNPSLFELRDEPPDWVKDAMAKEAAAAASQPAQSSRLSVRSP